MVATANSLTARRDDTSLFRPTDKPDLPTPRDVPLAILRRSWNTLTESYQTDEELWAWTGSWDL